MAVKKAAKTTGTAAARKAAPAAARTPKTVAAELAADQLLVQNLTALSNLVTNLSETLDVLVRKAESMAYHIIATEEVLAELVAANGLDLARVNARIRTKIAGGTDNLCDPSRAIDVAASIASPLPKAR